MTLTSVGLIALGYLTGSIPFGLLLTRWLKKTDVRAQGSGNIGATNVARVAGKKLGIAVLLLDALKGAAPILVCRAVAPDAPLMHSFVGLAAIFGHVAPVWLRFKGGKGVATALGVLLVLVPVAAGAGFLAYAVTFAVLRLSSVGSLAGGSVAVATAFWSSGPAPYAWLSLAVFVLLLVTHRANIRRLLQRSENRV